MQFHWPSLFLGAIGVVLVIMAVTGSYKTVGPALRDAIRPVRSSNSSSGSGGSGGSGGGGGGHQMR